MRRTTTLLFVIVAALVGLTRVPVRTQSDAKPLPFEVASIKPASQELLLQRGFFCGFGAGGRFMALGWLRYLIECAYEIRAADPRQAILGGATWADADLFAINASSPADGIPRSQSEGLVMLRTLLADRFKLVVHRETKEVPMWALVMTRRDGRPGPQLRPTAGDCAAWIAGGRRGAPPPLPADRLPCGRGTVNASVIRNSAMTLSQLANYLSPRVERPVQDRTGLTGYFDVDLQWTAQEPLGTPDAARPVLPAALDPNGLSLFTALQDQLGLKLESTRGPVDVLVIDHVEHPTDD
jgi:uncharacterized protein (TIGR03435 family)